MGIFGDLFGGQQKKAGKRAQAVAGATAEDVAKQAAQYKRDIRNHLLPEFGPYRLDQIDVVFLTTFRPVHRRALAAFTGATWQMHEPEIEAARQRLTEMNARLEEGNEGPELGRLVREERELLSRIVAADERLTPQVHLYPTAGVTPGAAGLLLAAPSRTIVIAGDAVVTQGYFEAGRVFEQASDVEQARASLADIYELADEIVPGHDNAFRVMGR